MKGMIFNLLEDFVLKEYGDEKYEVLMDNTPLITKEPFVGPGNYPDEDFFWLVNEAIKISGLESAAFLKRFGEFSFLVLADKFPEFVKKYDNAQDFIKSIDIAHQTEIKTIYEYIEVPRFSVEEISSAHFILTYKSRRKLCLFLEGLLDGIAFYYGQSIKHEQIKCMKSGADSCEFDLVFG